ncbi:MAG TPA: alpha/beta hydrolase, partial [Actinomycetes bacterium]|nr:alpha/beta hydrolase [Actinomycetes bacterium]
GGPEAGHRSDRCHPGRGRRLIDHAPMVMFPSNHGGFHGDEYGQPGQPDAFAAKLREVLAARA